MSIVRVGATKQYSDNWNNIFGGGSGRKATAAKAGAKPPKKSPKKSAKAKPKATAKKKAAGKAKKK